MRLLLAFTLVASLSGCGVKSDLILPNGKTPPKNQPDPSKPPQPIGQ